MQEHFDEYFLYILKQNDFEKYMEVGLLMFEEYLRNKNVEVLDYTYVYAKLINIAWAVKRENKEITISYLNTLKKNLLKNLIKNKKAFFTHQIFRPFVENKNYNSFFNENSIIYPEKINNINNLKFLKNMKDRTVERFFVLKRNFNKIQIIKPRKIKLFSE